MNQIVHKVEVVVPTDDRGGMCGIKTEDNGRAMIMYAGDEEPLKLVGYDDHCLFVRLHSWDESRQHRTFKSLMGRKVRITVEVVES